ncbi:MAG: hypothetical protein M3N45_00600 [Actinomycetota bacterium]|nr:hypothetical protein [Actinomycetota bacterium]
MDFKNDLFKEICTERRGVNTRVLKQTVTLAVEIAREGREGRKSARSSSSATRTWYWSTRVP